MIPYAFRIASALLKTQKSSIQNRNIDLGKQK